MELDTARTAFPLNAKHPGFDEIKRRTQIVDPGSRDWIVNNLAHVAITRSHLALPYDMQFPLQDAFYPIFNAQSSSGEYLMATSSTNPEPNELGPMACPPPSYETVAWESAVIQDQQGQSSTTTQATIIPLRRPDALFSEGYGLEPYGGFNLVPTSDATSNDSAALIQHDFLSISSFTSGNGISSASVMEYQPAIAKSEYHQFGSTGLSIPSAAYISDLDQQQPPQYHIGEYVIPSPRLYCLVGPSPGNIVEEASNSPESKPDFKFQPESTMTSPSELQKVPPLIPPQVEMMVNFSVRPEVPVAKRSRKSYSKEGKKKVHAVRKIGSCTCCQMRKLACSTDGVCDNCLRRVNHCSLAVRSSLAARICTRSKMKDDYIGVRDLHQSLARRRANLESLTSSLTGLPIQVQLCVKSEVSAGGDEAQLDFEVMRCSSSPICRWKRLVKSSGILVTSDTTYDERYVIVPASLPSVDDFDAFGRKILLMQCTSYSGAITWYLDRFLSLYCSRLKPTSLRHLANLTSRIASLNNLVAYGFLNLHDGSFDLLNRPKGPLSNERYVSETIHDQVRVRVAEGLGPAELQMASELDKLVKIVSEGKHARIIAGICLMRLVLIYRDRSIRDEIRISLPNNKDHHQYRLEKASSFYRRLTNMYWTLCGEKNTPLTWDWQDEPGERDATLENAYSRLQPAFLQFCERKLSRQHDEDFQELIAKNLLTQHPRKRHKVSH